MRAGEILFDLLELAVLGDDFFELRVLLGDLLEARGVRRDFRGRELLSELIVASAELIQFVRQCHYGHGKSFLKSE